ncbi:hypothetical protein BJ508DRAFT_327998 [Ascobolus immersus RN42]|uniref:Uncharacterized protein n=1 Tax=Ascobolus immersus RN42 TaxID=1160509 RepID=A0A3N4I0X5_ASCIM|nr:hypothetical protein BJ508DRAFT_327998 [Ascobolus immersus RN42]
MTSLAPSGGISLGGASSKRAAGKPLSKAPPRKKQKKAKGRDTRYHLIKIRLVNTNGLEREVTVGNPMGYSDRFNTHHTMVRAIKQRPELFGLQVGDAFSLDRLDNRPPHNNASYTYEIPAGQQPDIPGFGVLQHRVIEIAPKYSVLPPNPGFVRDVTVEVDDVEDDIPAGWAAPGGAFIISDASVDEVGGAAQPNPVGVMGAGGAGVAGGVPVAGLGANVGGPGGVPVVIPGGAGGAPVVNPGGAGGVPIVNPGGAGGAPLVPIGAGGAPLAPVGAGAGGFPAAGAGQINPPTPVNQPPVGTPITLRSIRRALGIVDGFLANILQPQSFVANGINAPIWPNLAGHIQHFDNLIQQQGIQQDPDSDQDGAQQ